jgi:hypothetical protein
MTRLPAASISIVKQATYRGRDMGNLKYSHMDINESDRGLTAKGRKNFDTIFCPFRKNMGADFTMHQQCVDCGMDHPDSFYSCAKIYRNGLPKAVPFNGLI